MLTATSAEVPREVGLTASRRRVARGGRVRLQATVDGCAPGDGVKLEGRGKTWSRSLNDSCAATFRVRMSRRTRFIATDAESGALSAGLLVRVKR